MGSLSSFVYGNNKQNISITSVTEVKEKLAQHMQSELAQQHCNTETQHLMISTNEIFNSTGGYFKL